MHDTREDKEKKRLSAYGMTIRQAKRRRAKETENETSEDQDEGKPRTSRKSLDVLSALRGTKFTHRSLAWTDEEMRVSDKRERERRPESKGEQKEMARQMQTAGTWHSVCEREREREIISKRKEILYTVNSSQLKVLKKITNRICCFATFVSFASITPLRFFLIDGSKQFWWCDRRLFLRLLRAAHDLRSCFASNFVLLLFWMLACLFRWFGIREHQRIGQESRSALFLSFLLSRIASCSLSASVAYRIRGERRSSHWSIEIEKASDWGWRRRFYPPISSYSWMQYWKSASSRFVIFLTKKCTTLFHFLLFCLFCVFCIFCVFLLGKSLLRFSTKCVLSFFIAFLRISGLDGPGCWYVCSGFFFGDLSCSDGFSPSARDVSLWCHWSGARICCRFDSLS